MRVCAEVFPPLFRSGSQVAECWLLGEARLDDAARQPLQRQEVSVADEA
jgi:hypothetical protein